MTTKASDALALAQRVLERAHEMDALVKKLQAEDMIGLECGEMVKFEKLSAENASAARVLAEWIMKEHG